LEVYELAHRPHVSKVVVLVVNLLIVVYLAWRLWKTEEPVDLRYRNPV
jgi:uncharacterized membrane protein (DUF2068 family)